MILRVYAMWNQSKRVLYCLLFIYVPQVILAFVDVGVYNNPNTYLSGMSQAKLQAKLESQISPLSPTTFFSSHRCPSYWSSFLQYFI